jgi:hypothetical protein
MTVMSDTDIHAEGEMSKLDPYGEWTDAMMAKVDGHATRVNVEPST